MLDVEFEFEVVAHIVDLVDDAGHEFHVRLNKAPLGLPGKIDLLLNQDTVV